MQRWLGFHELGLQEVKRLIYLQGRVVSKATPHLRSTLALRARSRLDAGAGTPARISDDASAAPIVAADGEVFFGGLETEFGRHNARGWLVRFDSARRSRRATPGR